MAATAVEGFAGLDALIEQIAEDVVKGDYTDPLRSISKEFETAHEIFFLLERSPANRPWAELAESTVFAKGHDTILQDTKALMESVSGTHGDAIRDIEGDGDYRGLLFGTDVEYGIFHQYGTRHMPARPFVGITEAMLEQATEIIADHAAGLAAYGPLT